MTYEKPEVICLGSAIDAIQDSMQKPHGSIDSQGDSGLSDAGGYASDE
jgi:hypothetical protein